MVISHFFPIAKSLALAASAKILEIHRGTIHSQLKEDNSVVTQADLASDQLIRRGLLQNFPDHAILTEENGLIGNPNSEFIWVVDPLDGTKAFAKKKPGFSVMVGLLQGGMPCLGVVVDPLEGHVYEAIRGQGTFHELNGLRRQVRVSARNRLEEMPLVISTGFPADKLARIQSVLSGPVVPPINSVGIKVGLMVRQVGDIYVNHHAVSYWDTVAPQIILEEAGGKFTFVDGSPLSYDLAKKWEHAGITLATNGAKHGEIVEALRGIQFDQS